MTQPQTINARDTDGMTALHYACHDGDDNAVTWLVEKGADITAETTKRLPGFRPIHFAIYSGKFKSLPSLLFKGDNIDAVDRMGRTALILAALKGDLTVIEQLIRHGANINATDEDGSTALLCTVEYLPTRAVVSEQIINDADDVPEEESRIKIAEWLIKNGADVTGQSSRLSGDSALHVAVKKGWGSEVEKFRFAKNFDINQRNNEGGTALHYVCETVVAWLIEAGADVNAVDDYLNTPLHNVARSGTVVVLKWLVGMNKAKVNAANRRRETALHLAAERGSLEIVKCLVEEFNADTDTKDIRGLTAEVSARIGFHSEVADYLSLRTGDLIDLWS